MRKELARISLDTEAAGHNPYRHSTLSIGTCLITRDKPSFAERVERGLVFYAEIKPHSLECTEAAMRVGCSQLQCLEEIRRQDPRYDTKHAEFDPNLVLRHMQNVCEEPSMAMERFRAWIERVRNANEVEGVVDTVFWDSVYINLCFGIYSSAPSPFGWKGLDIQSLYQGYTKKAGADLRELGLVDNREKPHRADHDAAFLADIAHELIFNKLGW